MSSACVFSFFGSWDIMSASSSGVGILYRVQVSSGLRAGIKAENDLETEPVLALGFFKWERASLSLQASSFVYLKDENHRNQAKKNQVACTVSTLPIFC